MHIQHQTFVRTLSRPASFVSASRKNPRTWFIPSLQSHKKRVICSSHENKRAERGKSGPCVRKAKAGLAWVTPPPNHNKCRLDLLQASALRNTARGSALVPRSTKVKASRARCKHRSAVGHPRARGWGTEVVLPTTRYWVSRATYIKERCVGLSFLFAISIPRVLHYYILCLASRFD